MIRLLSPGKFRCGAVTFDGSTDYGLRGADLTGLSDGKEGTISIWMNFAGGDGTGPYIFIDSLARLRLYFYRSSANIFRIIGQTTAPAITLDLRATNTTVVASGWTHVMASWNLATTTTHLYLDGSEDANEVTANDNNIDYAGGSEWSLGAEADGTDFITADVAEFYFDPNYIDLSQASNRVKFIGADAKPVNIIRSWPSGSQPLVYLNVRKNDPASEFYVNKGSGGDFIDQATLSLAATSPTD